jgi:hypothetical protein
VIILLQLTPRLVYLVLSIGSGTIEIVTQSIIRMLRTILLFSLPLIILLSCGKDDDTTPTCNTFTKADSVCFCAQQPEHTNCVPEKKMTLSLYTDKEVNLIPAINGTLWSKGFAIGRSIYIIDRESDAPHAFWKFDLDGNAGWQSMAAFPGTGYGLTGAANGKGYASSYASKAFWEYDPVANKWTSMPDLLFTVSEIHWVEHDGKYYVPSAVGVFQFDASTKAWLNISSQGASAMGAIFNIGEDIFFYNINDDFYHQFNVTSKVMSQHVMPDGFGSSIAYNAPFVLDDKAYVVSSRDLWTFDKTTLEWSMKESVLSTGCYGDDAFVVDGKAYLIYDKYLMMLANE